MKLRIAALLCLLFAVLSVGANAQALGMPNGLRHYIADAKLSAADSLHYMGRVDLVKSDGITRKDSLAILVSANDSLNGRLLLIPVLRAYPTQMTVADTVACFTQGSGIKNYVALNQGSEPDMYVATWFDIMKSLAGKWGTGIQAGIQALDVYFKVAPVGSEVSSSLKTFNVTTIEY